MTMDKPTVLIVEDNAITRKMVRVALESAATCIKAGPVGWVGKRPRLTSPFSFR